jgi:signal transduction histidine kinase
LLVLTDLSQTLREEERTAWQRLLRVLGHELNNSLAPIKSVAGSLADLLWREPRPADWGEDMQRGLEVISSRADSLARFVESYSKLARLPQPRFEPLNIGALVRRVAMRLMRQWKPAAQSKLAGLNRTARWKCGSETKDQALPTPRIYSCLSLRPRRKDPASGWSFRDRSLRLMAAR